MHAVIRLQPLMLCLAVPVLSSAASIYIAGGAGAAHHPIILPPFAPPVVLLDIMWSVVFLLAGAASYEIYSVRTMSRSDRAAALSLYVFVLISSCVWSVLFFWFGMLAFSFWWAVILLICAALCTALFYRIRSRAGLCMLPLMGWLIFIGIFNVGTWMRN